MLDNSKQDVQQLAPSENCIAAHFVVLVRRARKRPLHSLANDLKYSPIVPSERYRFGQSPISKGARLGDSVN